MPTIKGRGRDGRARNGSVEPTRLGSTTRSSSLHQAPAEASARRRFRRRSRERGRRARSARAEAAVAALATASPPTVPAPQTTRHASGCALTAVKPRFDVPPAARGGRGHARHGRRRATRRKALAEVPRRRAHTPSARPLLPCITLSIRASGARSRLVPALDEAARGQEAAADGDFSGPRPRRRSRRRCRSSRSQFCL